MFSRLTATLIWLIMLSMTGVLADADFERGGSFAPAAKVIAPLAGDGSQPAGQATE